MVAEIKSDIIYPESDGKRMAENTQQFEWIVLIKKNLDLMFRDDPNVFVAGDLLWYPVEGKTNICTAPDAMVVFGRPKGDPMGVRGAKRGSYVQHREDNIPPQVVFEILSPTNTQPEMDQKLLFYNQYGVEEYYLYNPDRNQLRGWLRNEIFLQEVEDFSGYVSPRLGIRFDVTASPMELYRPNGEKFLSYDELDQQLQQERLRAERLAERLRQLGVDPDQI
ncbi:Uma2 family endonuclease [Leptolyngbya sp. AN03gr2]|uniref:Uma2 family endonuclease n=1 Tax=unclassified Leptolyngbya TaxID=2650499 RepID=UPI003D316395